MKNIRLVTIYILFVIFFFTNIVYNSDKIKNITINILKLMIKIKFVPIYLLFVTIHFICHKCYS